MRNIFEAKNGSRHFELRLCRMRLLAFVAAIGLAVSALVLALGVGQTAALGWQAAGTGTGTALLVGPEGAGGDAKDDNGAGDDGGSGEEDASGDEDDEDDEEDQDGKANGWQ